MANAESLNKGFKNGVSHFTGTHLSTHMSMLRSLEMKLGMGLPMLSSPRSTGY